MRTATRIELAQSFNSRHVEGYALENDAGVNASNIDVVLSFLGKQGPPMPESAFDDVDQRKEAKKHLVWRGVDGQALLEMLGTFRFHADQHSLGLIDGQSSLFIDYCRDRIRGELSEWDLVIPFNNGRTTDIVTRESLETNALPLRARNSGKVKKVSGSEVFKPTGDRNSIRDPNEDPPLLLSAAQRRKAKTLKQESTLRGDRPFCAVRERPLMLVHFFRADVQEPPLQTR